MTSSRIPRKLDQPSTFNHESSFSRGREYELGKLDKNLGNNLDEDLANKLPNPEETGSAFSL